MQHWSEIQINNFNGPLDLLLTMIQAKKVRIEDVDLVMITNQYLNYLKAQQVLDLEIASEYLAMAAQLVEMKSWAVLPKAPVAPMPEAYQDFFHRLEDYDAIRKQATLLKERYQNYQLLKSKMISVSFFRKRILPVLVPSQLGPEQLKEIFLSALVKQPIEPWVEDDDSWMTEEAPTNYVASPTISPQEMTNWVLGILETDPQKVWNWTEIETQINPERNLKNLVLLFLVLLDLVHLQVINLNQIGDEALLIQFTLEAIKDSDFRERIKNKLNENS